MDAKTHDVIIDNQSIYLSVKEFDVLYLLYSHPKAAFTKAQIYESVWHEPDVYKRQGAISTFDFIIRRSGRDSQNLIRVRRAFLSPSQTGLLAAFPAGREISHW